MCPKHWARRFGYEFFSEWNEHNTPTLSMERMVALHKRARRLLGKGV